MSRTDASRELTGIVLAGGLSTRLGYDKAALRLDGAAGADLLAHSVALVSEVCSKTLIIGRSVPGHACVPDDCPGLGPVGGVATALRAAQSACLAISCDLPFMTSAVLQRLIDAHAKRPESALSTSYRQQGSSYPEALVAIYEYACLPFFEDCVSKRLLKISLVVPEKHRHFLLYPPDEALPFFNINSPDDLETALRLRKANGSSR